MNQSANATLALGASPIMATAVQEMEDLSKISGALLVNFGTISDKSGMLEAGTHCTGYYCQNSILLQYPSLICWLSQENLPIPHGNPLSSTPSRLVQLSTDAKLLRVSIPYMNSADVILLALSRVVERMASISDQRKSSGDWGVGKKHRGLHPTI